MPGFVPVAQLRAGWAAQENQVSLQSCPPQSTSECTTFFQAEAGPRELRASELVVEQPRAAHGQPQHANHPHNGHAHAHLSNGGGVLMGTKALQNGHLQNQSLSNGTHGVQLSSNGGIPVIQNGGPAHLHNGLNGEPNGHGHISEGKHVIIIFSKAHVFNQTFHGLLLTNNLKVGDWSWSQ